MHFSEQTEGRLENPEALLCIVYKDNDIRLHRKGKNPFGELRQHGCNPGLCNDLLMILKDNGQIRRGQCRPLLRNERSCRCFCSFQFMQRREQSLKSRNNRRGKIWVRGISSSASSKDDSQGASPLELVGPPRWIRSDLKTRACPFGIEICSSGWLAAQICT